MSNSNHFISGITFKMYKFLAPIDSRISWFFIILVFRVKCEFFVDSSNSLKRHTKNGFSFANFEANKFSHFLTPTSSFYCRCFFFVLFCFVLFLFLLFFFFFTWITLFFFNTLLWLEQLQKIFFLTLDVLKNEIIL